MSKLKERLWAISLWSPLWGGMIPVQILGIYLLYTLFTGNAVPYWYVYTIIGYVCIKMLGISACYHRLLSHRSFQVSQPIKYILLTFGMLSAQNSPIVWCLIHRGYHHRYSDTIRDPHSPKDGFWHSYGLWMSKIDITTMTTKYIPDLLRDRTIVTLHSYYTPIYWLLNVIIAWISIDLWLWGIILPAFLGYHAFALNTSVNHYKHLGYRNYETPDDSSNIVWLWPFIQGECWHNNHHGEASNPHFGNRRWYELDPTYWLIRLIRKKDNRVIE